MRYLLDTDHCSYIQRAHPEVVRHLRNLPPDAEVMTSVITQGELLAGIAQAPSTRRQDELRTLYDQLLSTIADILPVTSQVAERFAEVISSLVQKGTPVPVNDMWIASVALAHDLVVMSHDGHFHHIDSLQIEDWTQAT
ncbi:type II toxin-antitoxin system VapC family toxin [Candidatus Entotheonella palauensis]|uniref:type II toxin-antitoxin system VapC family toxin n=1 Tax=Candidatus Entotheonella palauensis TaxID=93172 RepID=UPI000B7FB900|nr:type II toxin-antitoxin system VapC family toxin [Candidatus Entotheonella palauensis]